jgi:HTH-type transcriptional regulator/antitoxin HigA
MKATSLKIDYVDKNTSEVLHLPITIFRKPRNEKDYLFLESHLNKLIDLVRDDENNPLAEVMQIIGENLEQYDNEKYPGIGDGVSDIEFITYLMKSHGLRQVDLAEIFGGQANVSRFLNGERALSKSQIIGIKNKFKISADFFLK